MVQPKPLDDVIGDIAAATAALRPAVDAGDPELILALVERRGELIESLAGRRLTHEQCAALEACECQAVEAARQLHLQQSQIGAELIAHHVRRQGAKAYRRAA